MQTVKAKVARERAAEENGKKHIDCEKQLRELLRQRDVHKSTQVDLKLKMKREHALNALKNSDIYNKNPKKRKNDIDTTITFKQELISERKRVVDGVEERMSVVRSVTMTKTASPMNVPRTLDVRTIAYLFKLRTEDEYLKEIPLCYMTP